jgi:hypothetical protein
MTYLLRATTILASRKELPEPAGHEGTSKMATIIRLAASVVNGRAKRAQNY